MVTYFSELSALLFFDGAVIARLVTEFCQLAVAQLQPWEEEFDHCLVFLVGMFEERG